jgi:hypothetical protein
MYVQKQDLFPYVYSRLIMHARIHIYVYLRYGERWRELRAAARDKGCTSETRASRATPAYI